MIKEKYVVAFVFSPDLHWVAMILKNKPLWQKGCWNGIGGKIEPGESAVTAMQREFKEETGVDIHAELWDNYCNLYGKDNPYKLYCFRTFTTQIFSCKTMEAEIVSLHSVTDLLGPGGVRLIPSCRALIPIALDKLFSFTEIFHKS